MRFYFNIERSKKRFFREKKSFFIFNDFKNVFFRNKTILPKRFIKFFRKKFKKFFRRSKVKFYLFIHYNYIISYKGKNPRMGKGIGFFVRKVILLNNNQKIFRVKGHNYHRRKKLSIFFKKKTLCNVDCFDIKWYY